jgi:Putative Actinobacterial Holin-X, holin superfamily III
MTDRSADHLRRDEPTAPPEQEPSLGELFGALSREFGQLMRQEVQLAKTELREEAGKAGRAAVQLTGAGVTGFLCVLLASLAAAWGIGEFIPVAYGLVIIAAVHGVVAAVLYSRGRTEAEGIQPVPDETIETLKEDARWVKAQPR